MSVLNRSFAWVVGKDWSITGHFVWLPELGLAVSRSLDCL